MNSRPKSFTQRIQGKPGLHSETLSPKKPKIKTKTKSEKTLLNRRRSVILKVFIIYSVNMILGCEGTMF